MKRDLFLSVSFSYPSITRWLQPLCVSDASPGGARIRAQVPTWWVVGWNIIKQCSRPRGSFTKNQSHPHTQAPSLFRSLRRHLCFVYPSALRHSHLVDLHVGCDLHAAPQIVLSGCSGEDLVAKGGEADGGAAAAADDRSVFCRLQLEGCEEVVVAVVWEPSDVSNLPRFDVRLRIDKEAVHNPRGIGPSNQPWSSGGRPESLLLPRRHRTLGPRVPTSLHISRIWGPKPRSSQRDDGAPPAPIGR